MSTVHAELARRSRRSPAVGGGQHDPGAQHVAVRAAGPRGPGPVSSRRCVGTRMITIRGSKTDHDLVVTAIQAGPMTARRSTRSACRAMMESMAKPPDSTKTSLRQRLITRTPRNAGPRSADSTSATAAVRLRRRRPARRRQPAAVPAALRRIRQQLGLRDLPRQPRRLRRLLPAQRLPSRHPRRSPRLRLRPLPQRPHRLAPTPDELTGATTRLLVYCSHNCCYG